MWRDVTGLGAREDGLCKAVTTADVEQNDIWDQISTVRNQELRLGCEHARKPYDAGFKR